MIGDCIFLDIFFTILAPAVRIPFFQRTEHKRKSELIFRYREKIDV